MGNQKFTVAQNISRAPSSRTIINLSVVYVDFLDIFTYGHDICSNCALLWKFIQMIMKFVRVAWYFELQISSYAKFGIGED